MKAARAHRRAYHIKTRPRNQQIPNPRAATPPVSQISPTYYFLPVPDKPNDASLPVSPLRPAWEQNHPSVYSRLRLVAAPLVRPSKPSYIRPFHTHPPPCVRLSASTVRLSGFPTARVIHRPTPYLSSLDAGRILTPLFSRPGWLPDRQLLLGGMFLSERGGFVTQC